MYVQCTYYICVFYLVSYINLHILSPFLLYLNDIYILLTEKTKERKKKQDKMVNLKKTQTDSFLCCELFKPNLISIFSVWQIFVHSPYFFKKFILNFQPNQFSTLFFLLLLCALLNENKSLLYETRQKSVRCKNVK